MPQRYISYNLAPECRVAKGESGSTLEWYPAVFDSLSEDLGGFREKIIRRAFTKTVQESDVRALFNHNPDKVLGRNKAGTLSLHVDHAGLKASVALPDTQLGRDLAVSVERGDITAGSFGFRPVGETSDWWRKDEDGWVRELKEIQLFDVSPVTFPAYPGTDGSAALRAIDGIFDIDDLVHPLIALRAGVPLAAQERDRLQGVLSSLQRSIEPPPVEHSGPSHRLRYFDMTLSMLGRGER